MSLQSLRKNDRIIVKKADKNSSTVVLDKDLYIKMAMNQLNDNIHYETINESHTTEISPLGNIIDDTDSQVIDNCIGKVDELLSRRHYTATLTRDLRRFKEDELPNYARIHKASFCPQLSSTETEHYFKGKSNCEQLWREACAHIKNGNNIPKLNNKVQETKEKWTDEYRKTASKAMNKENLGKNTKETDIEKNKQELEVLKRKTQREGESELVKLKREMEELKNSMKINNRSNRFNNNVDNHRGAFRGRRRQYDY
ncbi:unnamed protein product [Mytilus coruscus]|uniref:Uncharacterized protein n=1 Tax=Mytilus coruscus TaxID=42192 RepID=A0A6J8BI56_MYTCO|nr:unnamed protein product [Mytilus coruscus]